jgi:hypothetical protein
VRDLRIWFFVAGVFPQESAVRQVADTLKYRIGNSRKRAIDALEVPQDIQAHGAGFDGFGTPLADSLVVILRGRRSRALNRGGDRDAEAEAARAVAGRNRQQPAQARAERTAEAVRTILVSQSSEAIPPGMLVGVSNPTSPQFSRLFKMTSAPRNYPAVCSSEHTGALHRVKTGSDGRSRTV